MNYDENKKSISENAPKWQTLTKTRTKLVPVGTMFGTICTILVRKIVPKSYLKKNDAEYGSERPFENPQFCEIS